MPTLENQNLIKMESAVAAMCIEAGYVSASREAVEILAQVLQSCKFSAKIIYMLSFPIITFCWATIQ